MLRQVWELNLGHSGGGQHSHHSAIPAPLMQFTYGAGKCLSLLGDNSESSICILQPPYSTSHGFCTKIHYFMREFHIKLHAKTDIAQVVKR